MKVFEKAFCLAEVPEVHTTDDMGWGLVHSWPAEGVGCCLSQLRAHHVPRTAHLSRLGRTQLNPGPFQTCFFHVC